MVADKQERGVIGRNHFSVTVSRVGESMHTDPYVTVEGHTLIVGPDGSLSIQGERGEGRGFSAGAWDGFDFRRLPISDTAS
jgi:hypothetical protein